MKNILNLRNGSGTLNMTSTTKPIQGSMFIIMFLQQDWETCFLVLPQHLGLPTTLRDKWPTRQI